MKNKNKLFSLCYLVLKLVQVTFKAEIYSTSLGVYTIFGGNFKTAQHDNY